MNNVVSLVSSYLINSVWEVAVIGAAGWLVSRVLKRLGPQAQHVTWVATLLFSVAAPAIPICRSLLELICRGGSPSAYRSIGSVTAVIGPSSGNSDLLLPPIVLQALSIAYLATLLYFALRLGWLVHRSLTLVREAEPVSLETEKEALWNRAKQAFSLKCARVLQSRLVSGPVTIALGRPLLLIPVAFAEECTSQDFLAALAHECGHIRRRDFFKNLLYEIAALFVAFHPITWIVKSQIAQTREMICDGIAAEMFVERRMYAQSLLRLASMIPIPARIAAVSAIGIFDAQIFHAHILEKRILTIRRKKRPLNAGFRCLLLGVGALFLFSVAATSGAVGRRIDAQISSSRSVASNTGSERHHNDLSCTYWDNQVQPMRAYPGTCGFKKGDKKTYYCFRNDDKNVGQVQIGCAGKLVGK